MRPVGGVGWNTRCEGDIDADAATDDDDDDGGIFEDASSVG
jgi:hypothetical protein